MAATIQSLAADVKCNKLSLIGPLTEDDVLVVWEKVAQFVETLMLQQKGVSITGLGTFTFSKRKIDVGNNKAILIQRPVFVLSEKFIHTHSLHCFKQRTSGQIPLHPLNLTLLSNETGLSRELVEGSIREVLQALSQSVAAKKSIEFDLKDIGRLTIHNGKAKMSFFREFILRLDGSSDLDGVYRVGTAGSTISSIMSNPQTLSSRPSTTLSLPKIVQPIANDTNDVSLSLSCSRESSLPSSCPLTPASGDLTFSWENTRLTGQLEKNSLQMDTIDEENETDKDDDGGRETGVRLVSQEGKIISPSSVREEPTEDTTDQPRSSTNTSSRVIPKPAMLLVGQGSSRTPRTRDRTSQQNGRQESSGPRMTTSKNTHTTSTPCSCSLYSTTSRPSTCSHKKESGQELCYICHQRALRNVPVDLTKKREAMEKWQNDALQQYQHRNELLCMARVQANKTRRRLINQDIATFNQSRAENIKKQKALRPSEMDPSYVFCDRSPTPAPHLAQMRYCRELDYQVESKTSQMNHEREEEERSAREEQERLTKELAAYEELYRRMKAQAVEDYRAALKEQVTLKTLCEHDCNVRHYHRPSSARSNCSPTLPTPNVLCPFQHTQSHTHKDGCTRTTSLKPIAATSSEKCSIRENPTQQQNPVFGIRNESEERIKKEEARAFFLDQLATVAEKQRREKEGALQTLREDTNMLRKTKESLREDLKKERSKRVHARKEIEQEWLVSMREKQQRLLDELHRARDHGIRLHQQCEKYQRCRQCQRKRENIGKSNILHETRYTSGSRLMV